MSYKFDWSVLWTGQAGEWLLSGLRITLELSALAWLLAAVLGIVSGALRTVAVRRPVLDDDVPAVHPTALPQPLAKRLALRLALRR